MPLLHPTHFGHLPQGPLALRESGGPLIYLPRGLQYRSSLHGRSPIAVITTKSHKSPLCPSLIRGHDRLRIMTEFLARVLFGDGRLQTMEAFRGAFLEDEIIS